MNIRISSLFLALLLAFLHAPPPSFAQFAPPSQKKPAPASPRFGDSRDKVRISVIPSFNQVAPGDNFVLAVIFDHQDHWHIHTNNPIVPPQLGDPSDYFKTQLLIDPPANSSVVPYPNLIQWPPVTTVKVAFAGEPVDYGVFAGKAVAYIPVHIRPDAPLGPASLTIRPAFQACDDNTCDFPTPQPPALGQSPSPDWLANTYLVNFEILSPQALAAASRQTDHALFQDFDASVWSRIDVTKVPVQNIEFNLFGWQFSLNPAGPLGIIALLLIAAVGGLLLNFTPCVLPVIPLKIIGLTTGNKSRARTLYLGLLMFIGVVFFWACIGTAIVFVQGFNQINQLFQFPWFSVSVGIIIAVMAVGMCGLFAVRLPSFVYLINPDQDSAPGSFGFGIMTAVLSTPCTAPFMGTAIAWSISQPRVTTMSVFLAIGIGMGLPYFVLAAFPTLVKKLPRTGPANELLKHVMGLFMLAAAAYFIGVGISGMLVSPPQPPSRLYLWVVGAFVAAAGLWLLWRTFRISRRTLPRAILGVLGLVLAIGALFLVPALVDQGPIKWVYYTHDRFAAAKADRRIVVMEFTAEWCLNCKTLEKTVLRSPRIVDLLDDPDVVPIKVDLTGNNFAGQEMLKSANWSGIPLLIVFAPDGDEVFKSDYYTVDQVLQAVASARRNPLASARLP